MNANEKLLRLAQDLEGELRLMVQAVEAVPEWARDQECVFCGGQKKYGHTPDCPRQRALSGPYATQAARALGALFGLSEAARALSAWAQDEAEPWDKAKALDLIVAVGDALDNAPLAVASAALMEQLEEWWSIRNEGPGFMGLTEVALARRFESYRAARQGARDV